MEILVQRPTHIYLYRNLYVHTVVAGAVSIDISLLLRVINKQKKKKVFGLCETLTVHKKNTIPFSKTSLICCKSEAL